MKKIDVLSYCGSNKNGEYLIPNDRYIYTTVLLPLKNITEEINGAVIVNLIPGCCETFVITQA